MKDEKDTLQDEQNKKIIFEELKQKLDPGDMDKIMRGDPASAWTGTCYLGLNCTGGTATGQKVTISGCVALGGKSWKGDWDDASCINT